MDFVHPLLKESQDLMRVVPIPDLLRLGRFLRITLLGPSSLRLSLLVLLIENVAFDVF